MKRAAWFSVVVLVLMPLVGACSGDGEGNQPNADVPSASGGTATGSVSESPTGEPSSPLVGTWTRTISCDELLNAELDAHLGMLAYESIVGAGFVSGDPQELAKSENACEGAKPVEHSHFFTEEGMFGSLDENGQQVDDGTYELTNDRTFVLGGKLTFEFAINGDEIMFDPVIPDDCSNKCLRDAAYMVAVAYPGHTWTRAS